jgi:hypothetical protein
MRITRLSTRHISLKSGRPALPSFAKTHRHQGCKCRCLEQATLPQLQQFIVDSRTETILENHDLNRKQSADRRMGARTFPFLSTPKPPGT